jgi:hypothetical protein
MAARTGLYRLVNGEATLSVGTGSSDALETLGSSEDGVSVQITEFTQPIYNDVGGPDTPVDFQRMGKTGTITVTLVDVNDSVMRKVRNRKFTNPAGTVITLADGVEPPRGTMVGLGGQSFKLAIAAQWEDPWYFPNAKLARTPQDFKLGTTLTKWRFTFDVWAYIPPTMTSLTALTAENLPLLYSRAIP